MSEKKLPKGFRKTKSAMYVRRGIKAPWIEVITFDRKTGEIIRMVAKTVDSFLSEEQDKGVGI
jgi:hypothetical protein